MKKSWLILLLAGWILLSASCRNADFSENETQASGTDSEQITEIETTATAPAETESTKDLSMEVEIQYDVNVIGKDGEAVKPLEETVFHSKMQTGEDGMGSGFIADGYLAFYSVQQYLAGHAAEIPEVVLGEYSRIMVTASGKTSVPLQHLQVYDETYEILERDMTLADVFEKGKTEWKGKEVYLYFDITFSDNRSDYEESLCKGFFIKTTFL